MLQNGCYTIKRFNNYLTLKAWIVGYSVVSLLCNKK
jgi:hypothetical protein